MNELLKSGKKITSSSGIEYVVENILGSGGQGEVYRVKSGDKEFALKWYFAKSATARQKNIIVNLIEKGKPDKNFLWPLDLLEDGNRFGYIMELRPPEYKGIVDLMKRRAEPSFRSLCLAAFNLSRSYNNLHTMGYSYRDISFGNVFFDAESGDVLICDNDNVSFDGDDECSVYGTPRFMAPEIVTGKAKPSRNTDLYSLAVLLFYMLMLNHPLEGKAEASIKCLDVHAMNKLYGTSPVFIFDPINNSNRPIVGYQDNALAFWDLYPAKLKELFVRSFTVGLTQPSKRVTENEWSNVFAEMISEIIHCEKCGAESFFCETKEQNGVSHTCWNCQNILRKPVCIDFGKTRVFLYKNTKLYNHFVLADYDMKTVAAEVSVNPNNANIYGLKNLGSRNWTLIKPTGEQIPVAPQKTVAIASGLQINFGQIIGKIQ